MTDAPILISAHWLTIVIGIKRPKHVLRKLWSIPVWKKIGIYFLKLIFPQCSGRAILKMERFGGEESAMHGGVLETLTWDCAAIFTHSDYKCQEYRLGMTEWQMISHSNQLQHHGPWNKATANQNTASVIRHKCFIAQATGNKGHDDIFQEKLISQNVDNHNVEKLNTPWSKLKEKFDIRHVMPVLMSVR